VAEILSVDLLVELEQRWRDEGAPVATRLSPGLRDEEIDAVTSAVGIVLPTEARRWWRWHDGVAALGVRLAREREVAPGLEFLPLAEAVHRCLRYREISRVWSENAPGVDPEPWWGPTWFVIVDAGQAGIVAGDCAIPDDAPTPIRCVSPPEPGNPIAPPLLGSFGEVVKGWIEAFDSGAWSYADGWQIDPARRPPIARLLFG
jgi:cell wall assembly regulator SMI1